MIGGRTAVCSVVVGWLDGWMDGPLPHLDKRIFVHLMALDGTLLPYRVAQGTTPDINRRVISWLEEQYPDKSSFEK